MNPLAPSNVQRAATVPLRTADDADRQKVAKYAEVLAADNVKVVPMAFETTGAFGHGVLDFFAVMGEAHASTSTSTTFSSYGDTWTAVSFDDYWSQRFAVALRKGNALMVSRICAAALARAWPISHMRS